MPTETIEQRLDRVESELAQLKTQFQTSTKSHWIDDITGSFKDDPDFEEILRLGREMRQADRPGDE